MPVPMHGVEPTRLPPPPAEAVDHLRAALAEPDPATALRAIAARHPKLSEAWGHLAVRTLERNDPVGAYAFARTGYHRGLDALRGAGWRPGSPVPWEHEPNRGFLRSLDALRLAAERIGEADEAERCRAFLAELGGAGR